MDERTAQQQLAVDLLQELGLKEYEATCFVALTRVPSATAREVSDVADVPRTRVYDAIRVLEAKGLVEIQHSNPKRFRAVSIDEAARTVRDKYESRIGELQHVLRGLPSALEDDHSTDVSQEVWALGGATAIANRTCQLIAEATDEVVFVLCRPALLDDDLLELLRSTQERGVTLLFGTTDECLRERVETELPRAEVFVSGLEWLDARADDTPPRGRTEQPPAGTTGNGTAGTTEDGTEGTTGNGTAGTTEDGTEGATEGGTAAAISRLLLVDRNTILVSSYSPSAADGDSHEQAIFGQGFDNGLIVIARRLIATGIIPVTSR